MTNRIFNYLILLSAALVLNSCKENHVFNYENNYYKLSLNKTSGAIISIEKNGKNLIASDNEFMPLFEICFRDTANRGEVLRTNSTLARQCEIKQSENTITISYSQFEEFDHGFGNCRSIERFPIYEMEHYGGQPDTIPDGLY